MATPQVQAVRRWIMTGAVAAITVTGTLYGAGLKTDQEVKQVCPYSVPQNTFHSNTTTPFLRLEDLQHGTKSLTTSRNENATNKPRLKKLSRNSKSHATTLS
jgi:hypothetical protein